MKRITTLFLALVMLFTGCMQPQTQSQDTVLPEESATEVYVSEEWIELQPEFDSLKDENLLSYIENHVYRDTIQALNCEEYVVENVTAIYVSKEYLDEAAFNSQSNLYFGHTIDELDEMFQGSKYIFTLGDDGNTVVQKLKTVDENIVGTMLKNVAVGTGVIFVCVTVSTVSAVAGAPAVAMVFAVSATAANAVATSAAMFGGISAGVVRGLETRDFEEALEVAAIGATEGYKWGAISGAIIGGGSEAFLLKSATKGGLTMNEVAAIQFDSQYPIEVIARFNSIEQYKICRDARLSAKMVNGKTALVRPIDLNYVDDLTGKTNLQLMQEGLAPYDPTGQKYQLHHIGQKKDSPLAILTEAEHKHNGNNTIWHVLTEGFENPSKQSDWTKIKMSFWKDYAKQVTGGV